MDNGYEEDNREIFGFYNLQAELEFFSELLIIM